MTCLKELLKVDNKWVPAEHGYSLYIRPTLIGIREFVTFFFTEYNFFTLKNIYPL